MQNQGQRWKGLVNSSSDNNKSIENRSRSKKYEPSRNSSSQLNQKIKVVNASRLNISSQLQNTGNREQPGFKQSLTKIQQFNGTLNRSPIKSQSSFGLDLKSLVRPTTSINDDLASPTVLIKQLRQIKKTEQSPLKVTKVLFSLDEQHRYIHDQLSKIKIQFAKLKQIVLNQIVKQKKQIDEITKKIFQRFDQVLQICAKNSEINQLEYIAGSQTFKSEISAVGETSRHQIPFMKEELGPQIGIMRQSSSLTESQVELKRIFGLQSIKIDQAINKIYESPAYKPKYVGIKSDRIQIQNAQLNSSSPNRKGVDIATPCLINQKGQPTSQLQTTVEVNRFYKHPTQGTENKPNITKTNSKKQFERLFEAVNSLKKDIKDLKGLSTSVSKKQNELSQQKAKKMQKDTSLTLNK